MTTTQKKHVLRLFFLFIFFLMWLIIQPAISAGADPEDVTELVEISSSNEKSTMDRATRQLIFTATVTVSNTSNSVLTAPLQAVFTIAGSGVTMPDAQGSMGSDPYGTYYYDISSLIPDQGLATSESVSFDIKFFSRSRFTYEVAIYGVLPAENRPPQITLIPAQSVNEGSELVFTVSPSDPDPNDSVTLSAGNLPSGASFDPGTGLFSWTPGYQQAGNYNVTFTAEDNGGLTSSIQVNITVADTNRNPMFTSTPILDAISNEPYAYTANAADPDDHSLTFSLVQSPSGMTIDSTTGAIAWTPTEPGSVIVEIQATDAYGAAANQLFTITVEEANSQDLLAVSITSPVEGTVVGVSPISVMGTCNDDGATVVVNYTYSNVSDGFFIADVVPLTEGPNTLALRAENRYGEQVEQTIDVIMDSTPPVIDVFSPMDRSFAVSTNLSVIGTIADGTNVTCKVNGQSATVNQDTRQGINYEMYSQYPMPFNATVTLAEGTNRITITSEDEAGNQTKVERTVYYDAYPLTVTGVTPTSGSVGASVQSSIVVSFSEPVAPATVTPASFYASTTAGIVPGTLSVNPDGLSATLAPANPLPAGTNVLVQVNTGITDINGSPMLDNFASTFVTAGEVQQPGTLMGEVFDDARSQPLADALVSVLDAETKQIVAETTTDARGRYLVDPGVIKVELRISKAGYTEAVRLATTSDQHVVEILDARLTPLAEPQTIVTTLGAEIQGSHNQQLIVPPGTFATDTELTITEISSQGPALPFPSGWSPLFIVDLGAASAPLIKGEIAVDLIHESLFGRNAVLAYFDAGIAAWIALQSTQLVDTETMIFSNVDLEGQIALLLADADVSDSLSANAGDPLPAADPIALPLTLEATGSVKPSVGRAEDPTPAKASVTVTSDEIMRSGTLLQGDFMERIYLTNGGQESPVDTSQDLIGYQDYTDPTGNTLAADFAIAPSRVFSLGEVSEGTITVNLFEGVISNQSLIGTNGGGVITADGSRVYVPAGAFIQGLPIKLTRMDETQFPTTTPDGLTYLGGLSLDLSGQTSTDSLTLTLESPEDISATGSQVVVVEAKMVHGEMRLIPVAFAQVAGDGLTTIDTVNGVTLPGIRHEGQYGFYRFDGRLTAIAGSVQDSQGTRPGHLIEIEGLPFSAVSGSDGGFVLVTQSGAFTLVATSAGMQDETRVTGETETPLADITILPTPPTVKRITVRPPDVPGYIAGPVMIVGQPAPIIDDDGQGYSSGDGDGIIEAGETIELTFTVSNLGSVTAPQGGIALHVWGPDGRIETAPALFDIDPPEPDQPITVGPFLFTVPPGVDGSAIGYSALYVINQGQSVARETPFTLPLSAAFVDVSTESEITIYFSEALDPESLKSNLTLENIDENNTAVPVKILTEENETTVRIRPLASLAGNTHYQLTLGSAITDKNGRALADTPYRTRFLTSDTTPPETIDPGHIRATAPDGEGIVHITGTAGSVNTDDTVILLNETNGLTVTATVYPDGSFDGEIRAVITDSIAIIVKDRSGNDTHIPVDTLERRDPATGEILSVVIGRSGGDFTTDDGMKLTLPAGAVLLPTEIKFDHADSDFVLPQDILADAGLEQAFNSSFSVVARISIDADVYQFKKPVDIALPAPADTQAGDLFILVEENQVEVGGLLADLDQITGLTAAENPIRMVTRLRVVESATAKQEGSNLVVSTDSPPFDGITKSGDYTVLKVDQPLTFVTGTVVTQETKQAMEDAVVTSLPTADTTAAFADITDKEGTFIIPDADLGGPQVDKAVLSTKLDVFDAKENRTIRQEVTGTVDDGSSPDSTNIVFLSEDFELPDDLPDAFIEVLGDIEPPTVSIRVSGEALEGSIAKVNEPLTITVEADDNDAVQTLELTIEGAGIDLSRTNANNQLEVTITPQHADLITFEAVATDPHGNNSFATRMIRIIAQNFSDPLDSIPNRPPVVILPPLRDESESDSAEEGSQISFDKKIMLLISEPLDPSSVNSETIHLYNPEGRRVEIEVAYDEETTKIHIIPNRYLRLGACYKLEISSDVVDLNGESFIGSSIYLSVPPPIHVATIPLPNTHDVALYGEDLLAVNFPDQSAPGDNGTLSLYQFKNQDGQLLQSPVLLGSSETNGRPLSIAIDDENRIYIGNRFLGDIASTQSVINIFSSLIPGMSGIGAANYTQGTGANVAQGASNPFYNMGMFEWLWKKFPKPPSNLEVFACSSDNTLISQGSTELNRFVLPQSEGVPLQNDFWTLNLPAFWNPNTWPAKIMMTPQGLGVLNNYFNIEFFETGDIPKSIKVLEGIQGVGSSLGRCGGIPTNSNCIVDYLTQLTTGQNQCGGLACIPTLEFRDAAFFDGFAVALEENGVRIVNTDVSETSSSVREYVNHTLAYYPMAGTASATIAAVPSFSWFDDEGVPQWSQLAVISRDDNILTILDVTNPRHPERMQQIPANSGSLSVNVCQGLVYVYGRSKLHIIDINDPTAPRELNNPGPGRNPFQIEGLRTYHYSKMENVDGTVLIPGLEGIGIVQTKRCEIVDGECQPLEASYRDGAFFNRCGRSHFSINAHLPTRSACLVGGIVPDDTIEVGAHIENLPLSAYWLGIWPDSDSPEPVGDGSLIKWEVIEGPSTVIGPQESYTQGGFAEAYLHLTSRPGDVFVVRASPELLLDQKNRVIRDVKGLEEKTNKIVIVPGPPAKLKIERSKETYAADNTDTIVFTATLRDAKDNLVADGTDVFWELQGHDGTIISSLTTRKSIGGKVQAVVKAGLIPEPQVLKLNVKGLVDGLPVKLVREEEIDVRKIIVELESDVDGLDIMEQQRASITATFKDNAGRNVADGTPVVWFSTKGNIIGDPVIRNGTATAKLSCVGAGIGDVMVSAKAGYFAGDIVLPFTSSSALTVLLSNPIIVGDETESGTVTRERLDGSVEQVPYSTESYLEITGLPLAMVDITSNEFSVAASYDFENSLQNVLKDTVGNNDGIVFEAFADEGYSIDGEASYKFSQNATVIVPHSDDLCGSDGVKIDLWIRPEVINSADILHKEGSYKLSIKNNGIIHFTIYSGSDSLDIYSEEPLIEGEWNHITALYVEDTMELTLINSMGTFFVDTFVSPIMETVDSTDLVIGGEFDGNIDSLSIININKHNRLLKIMEIDEDGHKKEVINGRVQLNSHGKKRIVLSSLGKLEGDLWGRDVSFVFQQYINHTQPQPDRKKVNQTVVKKETATLLSGALKYMGLLPTASVLGQCPILHDDIYFYPFCKTSSMAAPFINPKIGTLRGVSSLQQRLAYHFHYSSYQPSIKEDIEGILTLTKYGFGIGLSDIAILENILKNGGTDKLLANHLAKAIIENLKKGPTNFIDWLLNNRSALTALEACMNTSNWETLSGFIGLNSDILNYVSLLNNLAQFHSEQGILSDLTLEEWQEKKFLQLILVMVKADAKPERVISVLSNVFKNGDNLAEYLLMDLWDDEEALFALADLTNYIAQTDLISNVLTNSAFTGFFRYEGLSPVTTFHHLADIIKSTNEDFKPALNMESVFVNLSQKDKKVVAHQLFDILLASSDLENDPVSFMGNPGMNLSLDPIEQINVFSNKMNKFMTRSSWVNPHYATENYFIHTFLDTKSFTELIRKASVQNKEMSLMKFKSMLAFQTSMAKRAGKNYAIVLNEELIRQMNGNNYYQPYLKILVDYQRTDPDFDFIYKSFPVSLYELDTF